MRLATTQNIAQEFEFVLTFKTGILLTILLYLHFHGMCRPGKWAHDMYNKQIYVFRG